MLGVIWHHAASTFHPDGLGGQGNKGVTLFFVISGFLIVTLLLRAKAQHGTFSLGRFWGRRMCRIFPVYYTVLGVYVLAVAWLERDAAVRTAFFQHVPAYATFTSNWLVAFDAPRVIFFFAWSLAAEEQFYLVWPWLERFLRPRVALGLAVLALVLTQMIAFSLGPLAGMFLTVKVAASVPAGILLGVILAHVLHSAAGFRGLWLVCGRRWSAPVFAAAALAVLAWAPRLGDDLGSLLAAVALVPLVASCVMREDNGLAWLLRQRVVAWIGTVSYGMYLLHMASVHVAHALAAWLGCASPCVDFVLGAALAVGFASLSYLTLEKFFLRRKERWFAEGAARATRPAWVRLPVIGSLLS